jgi:thiol-disulfide isomerase/thioredoxin
MKTKARGLRLRTWLLAAVAVFALVMIAAACSSDDSDSEPTQTLNDGGQSEGPTGDDEAPTGIEVDGGDEVLFVYSGADILGAEELTLNEVFQLGKPVVMNFWAGLCPPCRQEMPDFEEVHSERKDEFLMLGVDVGPFVNLGSQSDAEDLLDELEITYATAYVESDQLLREYSVFGMPTTVFLTADGDVVSQKGGFMTGDEMRERVQDMIDASE